MKAKITFFLGILFLCQEAVESKGSGAWCKIIIYDGVTIKEDGKILSSLWSISNLEEIVRLQLIKVTIIRFEQFFCKTLAGWR